MLADRRDMLRDIATRHALTAADAAEHRDDVWRHMQGHMERHPAVIEAWAALPGWYSYYDAACAVANALVDDA